MRAVIQRVSRGAVRVDNEIIGQIDRGYVVLLGIGHQDTEEEARWLARKVAGLRLFEDENSHFNHALDEVNGGILVISQFTLYGDARKGRRPSFTNAAPPDIAEPLVEKFINFLKEEGVKHVESGSFGAMMQVEIWNEGPVTLLLEREPSE